MFRKKKWDQTVGEPRDFYVTIPIAGSVVVSVTAESEQAAYDAAWDKVGDDDAEVTWEAHDCITEGNVLYADCNEVEIEEASLTKRR